MNISFCESKDGDKTLSIDNIFLHSTYSPQKEALRFFSSINFENDYKIIILIEPGLPYLFNLFKEKFPYSKIGIIRLVSELQFTNSNWDFVINFNSDENQFSSSFFSKFTEEDLLCSFLISWKPTQNIFSEETKLIWTYYKNILNQCKTVLITREYFEKKWILNTCNFIKYSKNYVLLQKRINCPIVITASGPSLSNALPLIKKYRNKFFLICLSSATKTLISNNVIPDFVLSTDGGYWAGEHLKELLNNNKLKLCLPCEGFTKKSILENNLIIPASYNDGISKLFLEQAQIPFITIERNGTVSGTAYKLSKQLTSGEIYFCGLDLASAKGFQHLEPNELEFNSSIQDFKLKNKETRLASSQLNSSSLNIYRNWFNTQINDGKNFRIIENAEKLKCFTDISSNQFEKMLISYKSINNFNNIFGKNIIKNNNSTSDFFNFIISESKKDSWQKQIFPIDFISIYHSKTEEEKVKIKENLNIKNEKLIKKIRKILNV